ncbi:hypothetical protein [Burkholderia mayonis]|nr:hypothetical protein [Burkholderia mayonis]
MGSQWIKRDVIRDSGNGYVSLIDSFLSEVAHSGGLRGTEVHSIRQICERQIREYVSATLSESVSADLSARWFEAYECGLAEGIYGEHAAITQGLAMRSSRQAGVMEEDSFEVRVTRDAQVLGVTHGYWLRLYVGSLT